MNNSSQKKTAATASPNNLNSIRAYHVAHLLDEGFTEEHITQMVAAGVCSLDEYGAMAKGFKYWDRDTQNWKASNTGGLYFHFGGNFGQIRLDDPKGGRKYTNQPKVETRPWLPTPNTKVLTEGAKDAWAGTLHGEFPTGALAGVSHYRKALEAGSGYTIIFDADGWQNPSVFANLISAGVYLGGRVQLLPEIEGEPKAGLCEYFKAKHTAKDYQELVARAWKPKDLLLEWPCRWKMDEMPPATLARCVRVALRLASLHCNETEMELLVATIADKTPLSKRHVQQMATKYQAIQQRAKAQKKATHNRNHAENKKGEIPVRTTKTGEPILPPASTVASILSEKYRSILAWHIVAKSFYRYEADLPGMWSQEHEELVLNTIQSELDACGLWGTYNAGYVTSVYKLMANTLAVKNWDERENLLPFSNGILDLTTKKFLEHSPGYRLSWQLPYPYSTVVDCGPIIDWLHYTQYGDSQRVALLRAYLKAVVLGRVDLQRFLELLGPGGSGKSTFIRLAIAMVGVKNTLTTTIKALEGNPFEVACLQGKRLIVITDSERYTGPVSTLKALTGGDSLRLERKNIQQDGVGFVAKAMVILAANEAVQSADYTSGLGRRRITAPFLRTVPEHLHRDLISINERGVSGEFGPYLSGFMNWVLAMPDKEMVQLLKNTHVSVPSLSEWRKQSLIETNPIAEWLHERVVYGHSFKTYVGIAEEVRESGASSETGHSSWIEFRNVDSWLYPNYVDYTTKTGSKKISLKRFSNLLEDLCVNQLKLPVKRGRDTRGSYFEGLAIKPPQGNVWSSPLETMASHDGILTAERTEADGSDGSDGSFQPGQTTGKSIFPGSVPFFHSPSSPEINSGYPSEASEPSVSINIGINSLPETTGSNLLGTLSPQVEAAVDILRHAKIGRDLLQLQHYSDAVRDAAWRHLQCQYPQQFTRLDTLWRNHRPTTTPSSQTDDSKLSERDLFQKEDLVDKLLECEDRDQIRYVLGQYPKPIRDAAWKWLAVCDLARYQHLINLMDEEE